MFTIRIVTEGVRSLTGSSVIDVGLYFSHVGFQSQFDRLPLPCWVLVCCCLLGCIFAFYVFLYPLFGLLVGRPMLLDLQQVLIVVGSLCLYAGFLCSPGL